MIDVEAYLMDGARERCDFVRKYQNMDGTSSCFGSVPLHAEDSLVHAKSTIYRLTPLVCLYVLPQSDLFEVPEFLKRIEAGLLFAQRTQRPSGCWDLPNCNFDSAPDTAFIVKRLAPLWRVLQQYPAKGTETLGKMIKGMLSRGAEGIIAGGFHTPNHRWAIASVLYMVGNILEQPKYKAYADQYLKEGIDCNEYGEYSERSAITYNCVNNAAMITLFEETGDETYLEYARRNLHMMLTYIDPNGMIFSENSHRQDKGKIANPRDYFYQYLFCAAHYQDDELGKAACKILQDNRDFHVRKAPDCLHLYLLSKEMRAYRMPGCAYPQRYDRLYKKSGVVRYRNGDYSYTLLEDNAKVLFFTTGDIGFFLRMSIGYFDQRHVKASDIQKTENGYAFRFHADGWYYQPLNVDKPIEDFFKADNSKRTKIIKNHVDIRVAVENRDRGFDILLESDGIDGVHLLMEWALVPGTEVETEGFYMTGTPGGIILVRKGDLVVRKGNDRFLITGMKASSHWMQGNYGSEPFSEDRFTICNELSTPFATCFSVRCF